MITGSQKQSGVVLRRHEALDTAPEVRNVIRHTIGITRTGVSTESASVPNCRPVAIIHRAECRPTFGALMVTPKKNVTSISKHVIDCSGSDRLIICRLRWFGGFLGRTREQSGTTQNCDAQSGQISHNDLAFGEGDNSSTSMSWAFK